jgi:hypothetical protein
MSTLKYHSGQLAIQAEAKTTLVAEQLAHWVGPVGEFTRGADMLLFAAVGSDNALNFTVLSGAPPLVEVLNNSKGLSLSLPRDFAESSSPQFYGGLAISFANARRARINGRLVHRGDKPELESTETFTLCKKYIAPSIALDDQPHAGPLSREPLAFTDPWLADLLARTETTFLASITPDGKPDVAHRGGPSGFLEFDAAARSITWNEFVGDGIFKSAGNLRATNRMTLLVPDFVTGDGIELIGTGDYKNLREARTQRLDALVQHREDFPAQGVITCEINRAVRLRGLLNPRRRLEKAIKITSRSAAYEQAPQ